jgi:hypothetical protein
VFAAGLSGGKDDTFQGANSGGRLFLLLHLRMAVKISSSDSSEPSVLGVARVWASPDDGVFAVVSGHGQ